MEEFDLPANRAMKKLSRGMHSAVGIVIGLAARAEVTLFDEPYLGLDAGARQIFYDRLLADYAEHPRTILLSTHLIDEVAEPARARRRHRPRPDRRSTRPPTTCAAGRSPSRAGAAAVDEFVGAPKGVAPAGHRLDRVGDRARPVRRPGGGARPRPGAGRRPGFAAGTDRPLVGRARGKDQRMTAIVKVGRLHLVDRFSYTWLVWGILALTFVLNLAHLRGHPVDPARRQFHRRAGDDLHLHDRHRGAGGDEGAAVRLHARGEPADVLPRHGRRSSVALCAAYASVLTAAVGDRGGDRRLGTAAALLPGALDPGRALVPGADHQLRAADPGVPARAVGRADLPALGHGRHGGVLRRRWRCCWWPPA